VFTGTTTTVEMNATGSKLRPVTRVGEFVNVPELVTMSSVYTDAVTREPQRRWHAKEHAEHEAADD